MRDRVLGAFLTDFSNRHCLNDVAEPTAFEHFVSHCVISRHFPDSFDSDDVVIGGGGDLGIDGMGILVNDHLVFSLTDVDYFKRQMRRLDVTFHFIQAKTSSKFDGAEIGNFISGVREFFGESLPADTHDKLHELHRIKEHIIASSIDMDRSPVCRLHYATTGTWVGEDVLNAKISQGVRDLKQTGLFSDVEFFPIDCEGLKRLHRELYHKITREMVFEKHTILPQIAGVQEAYIGIVPCLEYLKLISDDDGSLNRRLFYDNVRDFQGHNAVNLEIQSTLQDAAHSDRFALLNNGVTIVARDAHKVGATFRLKDYQVVNGCQTSHVLHYNKQHITHNVFLPLKLIVTNDPEVTYQIIQGTNRQTEVKLEALESLLPFQKKLEEFYVALSRDSKTPIYYERRSKQYEHAGVDRDRVITLAAQINCFLAMFLNEPHSTHRYYGELLTSYRGRLFGDAHSPMPYYTSGVALAAIDQLFRRDRLQRTLKQYRFQLLTIFRIQNEPFDLPYLNSKGKNGIDAYCQTLLDILTSEKDCEAAFIQAANLVESVRTKWKPTREPAARTKSFTSALLDAAGSNRTSGAVASRLSGIVKQFSDVLGWGFISGDNGVDYFVHYTAIRGSGFRSLTTGNPVEFTAHDAEKGPQAVDVAPLT